MTPINNDPTNQGTLPLTRQLNILLVDDDDIAIFISQRIAEMSRLFKSIRSATNGQKALDILNESTTSNTTVPDIILLDLDMPIMNGLAFLESFHASCFPDKNRITIIILTSSLSENDKMESKRFGVRHFLSKPLTLETLNNALCSISKSQTSDQ